jgi:hypothetical protein
MLAACSIACAEDLSGKWNMVANTNYDFILDLQQIGNQITGTMTSTNVVSEPVDTISGTISGKTIQFTRKRANQWTQVYTGSLSDLSIMGTFDHNGQGTYPWSAKKAKLNSPPEINVAHGDSGQPTDQQTGQVGSSIGEVPPTTALYRWFNSKSHDHFYTTDPNGEAAPSHGYVFEGITGYIGTSQTAGTTALYRWYNSHPDSGDHFYTTDPQGELAQKNAYVFEGITGYIWTSPKV